MTAIKKTITKSASSPAPATKSAAKPAAKKKSATAAATVTTPASAPAPRAVVTPAPVAPKSVAPVKVVDTKPVVTTIAARIDVGFGNALFIRGDGAGLSWDQGRTMDCIASDVWQITLPESSRPHTFKFLINDANWSTGPDYTAAPGSSVTLRPEF